MTETGQKMNKGEKILHMLAIGSPMKNLTKTVKNIAKTVKCTPDYVYQVRLKKKKEEDNGLYLASKKRYAEMSRLTEMKLASMKRLTEMSRLTEMEDRLAARTPVVQQVTTVTPNDIQVGGEHYKSQTIQPWDAINAWGLGFLGGNVVKYMARHAQKGGVEDLRKARHYLDKMIETMTKVG